MTQSSISSMSASSFADISTPATNSRLAADDGSVEEQFLALIDAALDRMGVDKGQVEVRVEPASGDAGGAAARGSQFLVTIEPATAETVQPAPASRAASAGTVDTVTPATVKAASQQTIPGTDWTEEMLGRAAVTSEELTTMKDGQAFLMARREYVETPTDARTVSKIDGTEFAMNAAQMSSLDAANAMLARLQDLGYTGQGVVEVPPDNYFVKSNYGSDSRRNYMIGEFNVGLLQERYAMYPKEVADTMTMSELAQAGYVS